MSIVKEYEEKFISAYCRLEYETWYQGYKDDVSKYLKEKTPKYLSELMEISPKLADENWERNQKWKASRYRKTIASGYALYC